MVSKKKIACSYEKYRNSGSPNLNFLCESESAILIRVEPFYYKSNAPEVIRSYMVERWEEAGRGGVGRGVWEMPN